jgi:hypothetical protein
MDRVRRHLLTGLRTSLNASRWLPERQLGLNQVNRYPGFKSRLFIIDLMVEAAGSGRVQRGLTLAAACHGRVRQLVRVRVFLSYGGRFPMRFAATGSP